jgi:hypothetical protein
MFKLTRVKGQPVTDEELISDLLTVATKLEKKTVSMPQYREHGTYSDSAIKNRFGSWNKALLKAGLELSHEVNISSERLFENIFQLWQHYGRQPRRRELENYPSKISQSPYNLRFRSWTKALEAFVDFANSDGLETPDKSVVTDLASKTGRNPSLRLRWKVLQRDRFTCRACGASPAITPGVELHVDHVIPWSKEGLTVIENLRALCSVCNFGKSNL